MNSSSLPVMESKGACILIFTINKVRQIRYKEKIKNYFIDFQCFNFKLSYILF